MNKIAQGLVSATAAILLLAGCSAVSAEAQGVPTPSASSTPSSEPSASPSSTLTAAPIPAEASAPAPSPSSSKFGNYTQDEFFLASMAGTWHGTQPSDARLIEAAHLACDTLRNGTLKKDVRVVDGQGADADWNNGRIVLYGVDTYCPEFN